MSVDPCNNCEEFWKDNKPLPNVEYYCKHCKHTTYFDSTPKEPMTLPLQTFKHYMSKYLSTLPKEKPRDKIKETAVKALPKIEEEPTWSSSYVAPKDDYNTFYSD